MSTPVGHTMDTLVVGTGSKRIFAPASGRNKNAIRNALRPKIEQLRASFYAVAEGGDKFPIRIIEVASGTGEHAAYLTQEDGISNLHILPVEPDETMHESIKDFGKDAAEHMGSSVHNPIGLDVKHLSTLASQGQSICGGFPLSFCSPGGPHAILCVNMIHISPYSCTESLFQAADDILKTGGAVYTYGPYRENGVMGQGNMDFDTSLKSRNSEWGIRDVEQVAATASERNFDLADKMDMPANNFLLTFIKR